MRAPRREAGIPGLLAATAFGLAFAQRPGLATSDTKINLHVSPARFLGDAAAMWTPSGQFGQVQAGQQAGYLFPMGPFFALGHAVGLSPWVVQRLWLGALLALAAWGVVRLLDALLDGLRGLAALVGGAVAILNPFVVTYANRTTVTLLAYAALPWLLLAVHRGVRGRRDWRWPAAFALLVAASGGGINGAVTTWMLLGPVLLLGYEVAFAGAPRRAAVAFVGRAALLTVLTSLWWVVPAAVQAAYGIDFLRFTEQPGTVWGTTSVTESLRLMGFWLSYVGIGFAGRAIPYFDDARTLLFSPAVVVATLLAPAAALGGFVWTRRWRYGPFFLGLTLVAAVIMAAGFPEGTPLRHGLHFTYNHVSALRFLRASYKAGPLLAVALACLVGAAAPSAARALTRRAGALTARAGARLAAVLVGVAAVVVAAVAAWPLTTGHAQDRQVSWKRVPAAWRAAAAGLDRTLPADSRALVLPGQLFASYRWGGTVDPILPALSRRPVAVRSEVSYADLRATDLLFTIDGLVHQRRLLPGQLAPLLSLAGVRVVVSASDDDLARSDGAPPADVAADLAAQAGVPPASRAYGPPTRFAPTDLAPSVSLPEVRRYDLPASAGLVRVEPASRPLLVDGSAGALAGLASFGALPQGEAILYTADQSAAALRAAAAAPGAQVVVSDSNRRRAFVAGSLEQNVGPTLDPSRGLPADGFMLDPFGHGPDDQTVAAYTGIRSVFAPSSPQLPQFPEHAAFAALDGSPDTAWLADTRLDASQRWLEIDFTAPRDVPYVDLLPYSDARTTLRWVRIAGRRYPVGLGWAHLRLGLRGVAALRVSVPGAGIRELRIPGLTAGQELRLPVDAGRTLSGALPPAAGLTYLFERTTGDDPFRRGVAHGPGSALDPRDPGDAEVTLRRAFEVPVARAFSADAWVSVAPGAPDDAVDRLAGYRGAVRATSSGRFDGQPGWRASRALDGDPHTAWVTAWAPGQPAWLSWSAPRPMTVGTLRLAAPDLPVRRPTRVRLTWPGGASPPLAVGAGGRVALPRPVSARSFTLEILDAVAPAGATPAQRRAVGVGEVYGVRGLAAVREAPAAQLTLPCGTAGLVAGGRQIGLRAQGPWPAFESGQPLRARSCGAPLFLAAGWQHLATLPGPLALDELALSSPGGGGRAVAAGGAVLDPGRAGRGRYDGVRVSVRGPSWLVLAESYDRGWRAWCNGRSLGVPAPVDGFANGWRVGAGCRGARFAFAAQGAANVGYAISGAAGLVCLALVALLLLVRRPPEPVAVAPLRLPAADRPAGWSPGRAVGVAVVVGVAFGFGFGVRAGAVAAPVLALLLWRAVGVRALAVGAGLLLGVVVPVLYLAHPGPRTGGNHFGYAGAHLAAHWVGVAALGLAMVALARTLVLARRS